MTMTPEIKPAPTFDGLFTTEQKIHALQIVWRIQHKGDRS